MIEPDIVKNITSATILSEAQLHRSTYAAVLLAVLLPPFIGGSLMGFMGFYPLPELYYVFLNYQVLIYIGTVLLLGIVSVPPVVRYIVGLTQLERSIAQGRAKRFFVRLPWMLVCAVTLYSVGGALLADFIFEAMAVRHYTVRQHLYNQIGLLPVVLICSYPVFFFFVDRLGRYLGPRGISGIAIPLWVKILMLGIVTPLLVESAMIGHYLNQSDKLEAVTLMLWFMLASFFIVSTWLAWRSLRQSLLPLENFIRPGAGTLLEREALNLKPLSLDELGVLTERFAELLSGEKQLAGRLKLATDAAHIAIWDWDLVNNNMVWDDRLYEICGLRREDFSNTMDALQAVLHPDDQAYMAEATERAMISKKPEDIEFRVRRPDGTIRDILAMAQMVLDADGNPLRMIGVNFDITERKQAEAKLRTSEEKLNEAQHIAHVGNWELDLTNGNLSWSDEIFNLFEIDKTQFGASYEAFLDAIHPGDREMVNKAYTDSLVTRKPYVVKHRLKMNDGRIKWVEERCHSEFDAEGKPLRSVGTVQDITELKLVERRLEKSESLYRTLAQVAPVGIFRTDVSGNCIYVNENYCELSGMDMDASLGSGWVAAIHPDDRVRVIEKWNEAVRSSTLFFLEFRLKRPAGQVVWVVGQSRAELGTDGKVLGYVGTITDISERKQAEEALKRLNEVLEQRIEQRTNQLLVAKEEAEQASRSKSLFLASMSHELRTPLNSILGYSQLMQSDPGLPAHIVENAKEIRQAGNFLLVLMNDILDLARIESGRMEMQIKDVDLLEVINDCRNQNGQFALDRNIMLACDENCRFIKVRADRHRLLQVLNNLVSNAIKYNREGGKVVVSCSTPAQDKVRVSVTDTGVGIASEKQQHLFEPFNRLGAEMGAIEGTGIGLVIVRRLIESMGGNIGVESIAGKGSTFWVELPSDTENEQDAHTENMRESKDLGKKFSVMVAEDYVSNQVVLRLQLQALGCEVDIAADGFDALNKWRSSRYDLILTDINMPGMDGLAFARSVREEERNIGTHTPIIAITATEVRSERNRCRSAGIDDVLTKPVALEDLRGVLSRWQGEPAKTENEKPEIPARREEASLDVTQLYRILGRVSIEQAKELIATFLISAREELDALESASSDMEAVAREMHKLKSSARTVGAMQFAKLAESLELKSKQPATAGQPIPLHGILAVSIAALRVELKAVETYLKQLHSDNRIAEAEMHLTHEVKSVNCRSVLIVDDDQVILRQMVDMLATLGVKEVLTANSGIEAIRLMGEREDRVEVLICDLNMPEMDGVELIRNFGQTKFKGGLILMSGTDEKVLSTVNRLAGLQGLRVLGQLQKPALPGQIAELLAMKFEDHSKDIYTYTSATVTPEDIIAGMAGNEFHVVFQPKVDAINLQPAGVEALARWRRSDGEFISPEIFISVAEQEGLIGELSKTLVALALQEGSKLFVAGYSLKISINLSGRWLDDLGLPEFILENTLLAGLRAEDVILEVTETGVMKDLTTALDVLTRLRLKGFGLSIDDFGIGYSSFEQLGRIPFTEMKLDRSFVKNGLKDEAALAILEGSMSLAKKLGLSTVAEGVENQEELELIRSLGCNQLQGYMIAKAKPVDELLVWLNKR